MGDRKGYRDPQDQPKKLFIGGLSYETSEEGLKTYFGDYGTIKDVVVIKDPETKKSRGFGFVTFEEIANVDAAQGNRPHTIEGKEVDTKRALSRDSRDNKEISKMFVGGLAKDTTEEQMREAFEKYGEVKSISIIKDKNTQEPRGFGFVEYTDFDYVDKCLAYNMVLDDQGDGPRFGSRNQTNKYKITVNDKKVDIKKADEGGRGDRGPGGRGGGRGGMQQFGGGGGYGGGYDMGGGYGGGYDMGYGGYDQGYGYGGGWGQGGFGENYGQDYGGGAMRGGGYQQPQRGMGVRGGPYRGGRRGR